MKDYQASDYRFLKTDRYGYATEMWHPVSREFNDACAAWHQGGNDPHPRIESAKVELNQLRRRIEDRLRKDPGFVNRVAIIFERDKVY